MRQQAGRRYNRQGVTSLQIQNPRERALVRAADLALAPLGWLPRRTPEVRRILLLRLERIGDLLMAIEAIRDVREAWPNATIHLAVGSWNLDIATLIPEVAHVHVLDVPWLSRGERSTSWRAIVREARGWRQLRYDLAINFEPDIRSNALMWLSGAPIRVGYASGGGGALLTLAAAYDPSRHVSENARRLIEHASGRATSSRPGGFPRLVASPVHVARAEAALGRAPRPLIGVHVSGGRESKQWHLDRFAAVARMLASMTDATIVLTGSRADRPMVDEVARQLDGVSVRQLAGELDLPETAAVLGRLDLFVTGDTGPMHLAAAMGVPVVALFGPSDPNRYGPRASAERIVRVQLPCSPCGQVRLPPERCRGHVPDCMDGISVDAVVAAALDLLGVESRARHAASR